MGCHSLILCDVLLSGCKNSSNRGAASSFQVQSVHHATIPKGQKSVSVLAIMIPLLRQIHRFLNTESSCVWSGHYRSSLFQTQKRCWGTETMLGSPCDPSVVSWDGASCASLVRHCDCFP